MPSAMTFDSLQQQLRDYLERGNVADVTVFENLPNLINQAERSIANRLKIQGFINNVTTLMQAGLSVYPKPDRWRRTLSMNFGRGSTSYVNLVSLQNRLLVTDNGTFIVVTPRVGNRRTPLLARSLEYCQSYWPDQSQTGTPKFYADYDYYHWLVVPTPDVPYPWAINYYQMLPLLDDTNQQNWLTQIQPNTLLYRALLECTPFLKNDERIQTWQNMYETEISSVNTQDLQKAIDRGSVRNEA